MSRLYKKLASWLVTGATVCFVLFLFHFDSLGGWYAVTAALGRGGSYWRTLDPDDAKEPNWIRLALSEDSELAAAGTVVWTSVEAGFESGELPVLIGGEEVDKILLLRLDPARFTIGVHVDPYGGRDVKQWLDDLDAVAVINGSYYGRDGRPATPTVSGGVYYGPADYDARHGGVAVRDGRTSVLDLANVDWREALSQVSDGFVSYPMLVAPDGSDRVQAQERWLANRSFIGQDGSGRIILGTTATGFFSLPRFARFLRSAPLDLRSALNLDGGPVACQALALSGAERNFCGSWEVATRGDELRLLEPGIPGRRWRLPIVLAVKRIPSRASMR